MLKYIWLSVFLIPHLGLSQNLTPCKNPAQALTIFQEINTKNQSLACDFIQHKHFSFMDKPLISEGKFYYQQQENLRWEYQTPIKYILIVSDGLIKISEDGQTKEYSANANVLFKTIKETIMGCVNGSIVNDPKYTTQFYENENELQLKLTPKGNDIKDFMAEINIYVNKHKGHINKLLLIDGAKDSTEIIFENIEINQPIEALLFKKL